MVPKTLILRAFSPAYAILIYDGENGERLIEDQANVARSTGHAVLLLVSNTIWNLYPILARSEKMEVGN